MVTFSLERIPLLAPRIIAVDHGRVKEPRMVQWITLMACHSEGVEVVRFTPSYFHWLENQIIMIEYFPYAGIDFRSDREVSLPPGTQWDDSGKNHFDMF